MTTLIRNLGIALSLSLGALRFVRDMTLGSILGSTLSQSLLDQLWEGKVDEAIGLLREAMGWVRNPKALEDLIGYLEKRRWYIPDYGERQRAGLWIASTRVEKFNDWAVSGRCKHQGMSWSSEGVLALAALEAAAENGELDAWREGFLTALTGRAVSTNWVRTCLSRSRPFSAWSVLTSCFSALCRSSWRSILICRSCRNRIVAGTSRNMIPAQAAVV